MADDQSNNIAEPDPETVATQEQDANAQADAAVATGSSTVVTDGSVSDTAVTNVESEGATTQTVSVQDELLLNQKREDERRRNRLLLQQQDSSGGLFLLLALIFSAAENGNDSLDNEETSNGLASMLGLDFSAFQQTVSDVRSGRVSAQDAASSTYSSVNPSNVDFSRAPNVSVADLIRTNNGPTLLNPDLVQRMESNATVKRYVEMTMAAAERHGLDGNLLANQLWQESRFNPNATSEAGARGIAQFMPFHRGKWGLETDADFRDPAKSIEASARFMRHLTDRVGSQQLALVAYNGGEKAVEWVSNRTPGSQITVADWMAYAGEQRARLGVGSANLWRNQTFDYVTKIDSNYWNRDMIARAERQGQTTVLASAFAQGGTDQTGGRVNPVADGLTAAYTQDVVTGGGVDQTTLAANTDGTNPSGTNPIVRPT